jgi:dihydroorotate dehydrogenase
VSKTLPKPAPLTPTALRTRWALLDLASARRDSGRPAERQATSVQAMGLHFPSPLGLAAGFDRAGALIGRAGPLGLGAVEIGSVSAGSRDLLRALHGLRRRSSARRAIIGISLVKRAATPWPPAAGELLAMLRQVHGLADYLTLNPGRDCPDPALFAALFGELAHERDRLTGRGRRTPLVAKLPARWLACTDPAALAQRFAAQGADGIMLASEGHSGLDPLDLLRRVSAAVGPEICLISVGGATTATDVLQRLQAGATFVQAHGALRRAHRRHWIAKVNSRLARHIA